MINEAANQSASCLFSKKRHLTPSQHRLASSALKVRVDAYAALSYYIHHIRSTTRANTRHMIHTKHTAVLAAYEMVTFKSSARRSTGRIVVLDILARLLASNPKPLESHPLDPYMYHFEKQHVLNLFCNKRP